MQFLGNLGFRGPLSLVQRALSLALLLCVLPLAGWAVNLSGPTDDGPRARKNTAAQPKRTPRVQSPEPLSADEDDGPLLPLDDEPAPQRSKNVRSAKVSEVNQNHWQKFRIGVGPVLSVGEWIAVPERNKHLGLMLAQRLQKDVFFAQLGASGFFSLRSPANLMWSVGFAPGVMVPHIKSGPYLQIPLNYTHISSTGRGAVNAFSFGVEIGFHLLWIQERYPLFLQVGYGQVTKRLAGKVPAWYSLMLGVEI